MSWLFLYLHFIMTPLDLKLNQYLNILPSKKPGFIFTIPFKDNLHNHFNSVHAAVIFSLAEATSAQFLLQNFEAFQNEFIPLLRSTQTKFKKPAFSSIHAKAEFKNATSELIINDLQTKNRALVTICVNIEDEDGRIVFTSELEWFLALKNKIV